MSVRQAVVADQVSSVIGTRPPQNSRFLTHHAAAENSMGLPLRKLGSKLPSERVGCRIKLIYGRSSDLANQLEVTRLFGACDK